MIGGHVERGESSEQALVREFQEELGIALISFRHFATLDIDDPGGEAMQLEIFEIDDWLSGEPIINNDEHDQINWFTPEEASSLKDLADPAYIAVFREIDAAIGKQGV